MIPRLDSLFIILFCLIYSLTPCPAQENKTIDSLLRSEHKHIKEDSFKIKLWLKVADEYVFSNPKEGLKYAENAINLSRKLNLPMLEANALLRQGYLLSKLGKISDAEKVTNKSLEIFLKYKNNLGLGIAYHQLGIFYNLKGEPYKALDYFTRSINKFNLVKEYKELAGVYGNISSLYVGLGNYSKALEFNEKALKGHRKLGNKRGEASNILNRGIIYYTQSDYLHAIECYNEALKINKGSGNKASLARIYLNLGMTYEDLRDIPRALKNYKIAMNLCEEIGEKNGLSFCYIYIAGIHYTQKNIDSALYYETNALKLAQSIGNKTNITASYGNMATYYIFQKKFDRAIDYNRKSRQLLRTTENKRSLAYSLEQFGRILLEADNLALVKNGIPIELKLDSVFISLSQAMSLANELGEKVKQRDIWELFSEYYAQRKDFPNSLSAYKKYISTRDSIDNLNMRTEVARKDIQFQFDRRGDSLVFENKLAHSKLQHQVLLGREQNNKLQIANQDKELKQLEWLGVQSDLQQEQLLRENKERLLLLSEKEQELQKIDLDKVTSENELHKLRLHQQQLLGLALLLSLMGIAAFLFSKYKIKKEREKSDLERRMSEATLSSLHSQMNPHFIFNCLGSIKQMIQLNEQDNANTYLNKFAKLIRLSLEHSRRPEITLREKNTYLINYLDMEQLRFDKAFEYRIEVAEDLDIDEVTIPPMMIQPLVENALWHGLMNKEADRKLLIGYQIQDDKLICTIEDNGVGINHSKSHKEITHNSIGIKNIIERLAILNRKYKLNYTLSIVDKSEENKNLTRTLVTLTLPAVGFRD